MSDIEKTYKNILGEPDEVVKTLDGLRPMKAIKYFVSFPVPDDDDRQTLIATVGLSNYPMRGDIQFVELIIRVKEKIENEELKEICNSIYSFHEYLISSKIAIYSSIIIENVKIALFSDNNITSTMLIDWDYFEPTWLNEPENTIRLLEVIPLFTEEGASLSEVPGFDRFRILWNSKVEYWNYKRKIRDIPFLAIKNIWLSIKEWFVSNSVAYAENVAVEHKKNIANDLQNQLQVKLPPDFYASIKINSVSFDINEYTLLNESDIAETWNMMKELNDEKRFEQADHKVESNLYFKKMWWNLKWIPFAKNSFGDKICIDLDPGPSGNYGQILYHFNDQGPILTEFRSFLQWLLNYYSDLQNNKYKVVDGFIEYTQ